MHIVDVFAPFNWYFALTTFDFDEYLMASAVAMSFTLSISVARKIDAKNKIKKEEEIKIDIHSRFIACIESHLILFLSVRYKLYATIALRYN